mmetsp:Transcript_9905/g.19085  ORF Transcript_9905/g.19085 Transcript_9905/m.19085 type:complete len:180 (-) Transcript_9905:148-687(-)
MAADAGDRSLDEGVNVCTQEENDVAQAQMMELLRSLQERQSNIEEQLSAPSSLPEFVEPSWIREESTTPAAFSVELKGIATLSGEHLPVDVLDGELVSNLRKRIAVALGKSLHHVKLICESAVLPDDAKVVVGGEVVAMVVKQTSDAKFACIYEHLSELDSMLEGKAKMMAEEADNSTV